MKKYYTFIFALLLSTSLLKAQFATIGSKWYYGNKLNQPPFTETCIIYEAVSDTVISNDTFIKIQNKPYYDYYLKQDSSKTYYWMQNRKCLLFDAGIKKGDTIAIDAYFLYNNKDTSIKAQIILDTIYYIKKNMYDLNDTMKIFRVKPIGKILGVYFDYGYFTEKFIKNIYFDNFFLSIFNLPSTGEVSNSFRCFNSPNYSYKDSSLGTKPCDFTNTGLNDYIKKNEITIFPNPANGELGIALDTYMYQNLNTKLFDYSGKLLKQSNFINSQKFQIDISDLAAGIYFIECVINGNHSISKFIKR